MPGGSETIGRLFVYIFISFLLPPLFLGVSCILAESKVCVVQCVQFVCVCVHMCECVCACSSVCACLHVCVFVCVCQAKLLCLITSEVKQGRDVGEKVTR